MKFGTILFALSLFMLGISPSFAADAKSTQVQQLQNQITQLQMYVQILKQQRDQANDQIVNLAMQLQIATQKK